MCARPGIHRDVRGHRILSNLWNHSCDSSHRSSKYESLGMFHCAGDGLGAAENNEITVISAVVESAAFLEEQCEAYRHHKVTERRTIRLHHDSAQCTIASDPALLGRVNGNMIKNALEVSVIDGTVTVGWRQLTDRVEFWVHNSTFIPQKEQQQMF